VQQAALRAGTDGSAAPAGDIDAVHTAVVVVVIIFFVIIVMLPMRLIFTSH
jgi:uncharacterized membrane protein